MHSKLRFSLLTQTGIVIGLISLLAVIGISSSVFITQTIQGAATTINTSGTLRMLSYKIATQMMRDQRAEKPTSTKIRGLIRRFDSKLNHPSLKHSIPQPQHNPKGGDSAAPPLYTLYNSVHGQWREEIQPLLLSYASLLDIRPEQKSIETTKEKIHSSYQQNYLARIDEFVLTSTTWLPSSRSRPRIEFSYYAISSLFHSRYFSSPFLLHLSCSITEFLFPLRICYRYLNMYANETSPDRQNICAMMSLESWQKPST